MGILNRLLDNPLQTLLVLLLALPGRMLAIAAHESAHGLAAEYCGDKTARWMGRITLNPLKHLDPVGFVCFLFLGIGWARPVPVNPNNFREGRKSDLIVSLAGVAMNLLLFLVSTVILYAFVIFTLAKLPVANGLETGLQLYRQAGEPVLLLGDGTGYYLQSVLESAPYLSDIVIAPVFGRFAGYAFDMLSYFVLCNFVLALFNLIPLPPLDGYHVLNDIVLKRSLFASRNVQRVSSVLLLVLVFSDAVSKLLNWAEGLVFGGFGSLALRILMALKPI